MTVGTPAISKHDLNEFPLPSHQEHITEFQNRGYLYQGFYVCENGVRELGSVEFKEWYAFVWKDGEGVLYRTEQAKDKVTPCDVITL